MIFQSHLGRRTVLADASEVSETFATLYKPKGHAATLLGAPGIATRGKDATRGSWPYYQEQEATRGSWHRC